MESCGIEPQSPHQRRLSVFFLDFWFLCCVWNLVRPLQLYPRLLKCGGIAYWPLTSGCRSSPSGCGRAPSRRRQLRRWPCSRCQPRRCTAGGPGRSGRRPWRTRQQRSGRKGSGTSAAQRRKRQELPDELLNRAVAKSKAICNRVARGHLWEGW